MLDQKADHHLLMRRMHKPDPKLAPDKQDKRSVVALEPEDFEKWLQGTIEEATDLICLTPAEFFDAAPERFPTPITGSML